MYRGEVPQGLGVVALVTLNTGMTGGWYEMRVRLAESNTLCCLLNSSILEMVVLREAKVLMGALGGRHILMTTQGLYPVRLKGQVSPEQGSTISTAGRHISTEEQLTVSHTVVLTVAVVVLPSGATVVVVVVVTSVVVSNTVVPSGAAVVVVVVVVASSVRLAEVSLLDTFLQTVSDSACIADTVGTTISPSVETVAFSPSQQSVTDPPWTVSTDETLVRVCTLTAVHACAVHARVVTFTLPYTKWSVVHGATVELFSRNTEVEELLELDVLEDLMKVWRTLWL